MKRPATTRLALSLALCSVATIRLASATDAEGTPEPGSAPSPGDRGMMLTAIAGGTIEEVPLTYLGVQRDLAGPGYDVHLVRLEGPVGERIGVAAGMSGSPVYFGGELLGALAYRFGALPREAVGGVTPIDDILGADRARPSAAAGPGDTLVTPIATPVQISGLTGAVRRWLEPQLDELGFMVVAGGEGAPGDDAATPLVPGAPVGVALVRGDLSIAATGTVTYVDRDTVYAFGHPFLGSGSVEMPMVAVDVVHTLADLAGSVKMTRVRGQMGAIVEDRLTAIVGRFGLEARMIPLELVVRGGDYGDQRFDFELARSPVLSPILAAVSVANALSANVGYRQQATMLARGEIVIRGMPRLPIEVAATSGVGADPAIGVAAAVQQVLGTLWINPFSEVELDKLALEVRVDAEVRSYRVDDLHYDRGLLRPGQNLTVECVLRKYRGETVSRSFEIHVPDDLPADANLALVVGSPTEVDRALGRPLARRYGSVEDVRAVIDILADLRAANRLTAVLYRSSPGVVSRGAAYSDLPPSAERLMTASPGTPSSRNTTVSELFRTEVELDGPVEGGVVVRLRVDSDLSDGIEAEDRP
ncbi:MAG TPA: hypothetical protein VD788_08215 [Candidatus Polarisedimenticolaceae bacterium]|nr:hypothetical protein [Candidatus Polarisedimenticolaceae bacterium]